MGDSPFVGEIIMFGGNFAPAGWELCDGRLMAISENDALFTLLGTTFGGDGQITFGLPDLRGCVPVHQGQGPGISNTYVIGERGGVEQVTLSVNQMPIHNHPVIASTGAGTTANAQGNTLAASPSVQLYTEDVSQVALNAQAITPAGGSQPHENLMPFVTINYVISLFGIFPQQN